MSEITKTPEILDVDSINGLALSTKNAIQEAFLPFAQQFAEWEEKAQEIKVTDVSQTDLMKIAGEGRKVVKKIRTGADGVREELKRESLQYGRAVQEIYNKIKSRCEPIEAYLEEQEKFKELEEAKQRQKIIVERMEKIKEFPSVTSEMVINLSDEMFETFLNGLTAQKQKDEEAARLLQEEEEKAATIVKNHQDRKNYLLENGYWAALSDDTKECNFGEYPEEDWNAFMVVAKTAKKEEEQRLAAIEAESQRIKLENEEKERLREEERKAEQAAREKAAAEAKAIQDAKDAELKAEREKAQKLQDEIDAKLRREAELEAEELAAEKKRIAEEKKAAKAPDKSKLLTWVGGLECALPEMNSEETKQIALDIQSKYEGFKNWATEKINSI
jgi:hypothetical protein